MMSHTTERFRNAFQKLPGNVQKAARKAYLLWKQNPQHRSLQFKQIHSVKPIYSVRVGRGWRAVGVKDGQTMIWFWIGSHADYNQVTVQL